MKSEFDDLFNIIKIGFVLWFCVIVSIIGFLGWVITKLMSHFGII